MEKNYTENKDMMPQNWLPQKKPFLKEKVWETIGKTKELWESLKSIDMSNKTVISNFSAIEENDTFTCDFLVLRFQPIFASAILLKKKFWKQW